MIQTSRATITVTTGNESETFRLAERIVGPVPNFGRLASTVLDGPPLSGKGEFLYSWDSYEDAIRVEPNPAWAPWLPTYSQRDVVKFTRDCSCNELGVPHAKYEEDPNGIAGLCMPYIAVDLGGEEPVAIDIPALTNGSESDATDRWDLVPDVLVSYETDTRAVSLAQQNAGFDYVDQVWVDGVPYGVVELDVDVEDEFLPTIRFSYRHGGADVRARCYCGWNLVYSDLCKQRGVLVEDPGVNMQAFVASLLRHVQSLHAGIDRSDVCEHGFRRYVQSKSRATGQPFRAKFCASRTKPCDPVWVND